MHCIFASALRFPDVAGLSALAKGSARRGCTLTAACILIAVVVRVSPAHAQQFPGFGGVGVGIGAAWPQDANMGLEWSADADLGYLKSPRVRVVLGLSGFSADVDRVAGGAPVDGSLSTVGGHSSLRIDPLGTGRFTPYLTLGLRAANVSADVSDEATKDLLEGFYAGAGVGAGMTYALDEAGRFAATAETRRVWMNNVGHWALDAGLRFLPRGGETYARVTTDPVEESRRVAEAGREQLARIERERQLSDSLAAARGDSLEALRAEAERQREAEAQRAQALREAERRAEQARAETQLAQMRARGDSLEAARRAEAERRARAEAEAEDARRRAAESDSARRAAERSAAEAARQRYQALLDLHRLITSVTEIRESERGLVVVLGQGLFASGQYQLSARARDEVGTIAAVLSQYPDHQIVVEGHTDSEGGELANQRLSEQRADAVRAALIAMGVDPSRVRAVGFGESRPTADNAAAEGRAANRRVEIVIEGARAPASEGAR